MIPPETQEQGGIPPDPWWRAGCVLHPDFQLGEVGGGGLGVNPKKMMQQKLKILKPKTQKSSPTCFIIRFNRHIMTTPNCSKSCQIFSDSILTLLRARGKHFPGWYPQASRILSSRAWSIVQQQECKHGKGPSLTRSLNMLWYIRIMVSQ